MKAIIKKPVISEKSISQGAVSKYTFLIDSRATKQDVKATVSELFKVTVEKVNMLRMPGKKKRFKRMPGQRAERKHAIVTLKKGDRITLFEENK